MGTAPYLNPEAYAEATARARAYLFATDADAAPAPPGSDPDTGSDSGSGSGSGSGGFAGGGFTPDGGPSGGLRRRNKVVRPLRPVRPVRAGLLGVSVAVALGVIAVATGVVPGLENYRLGGGSHVTGGDRVQTAAAPSNSASPQGGTSGSATGDTGGRTSGPAVGGTGRTASPSPSSSASASPSPSEPASHKPARAGSAASEPAPSKTAAVKPAPRTTAPKPSKSPLPSRSARPPQPSLPASPPKAPKPSASATSAVPEPTPSRTATKAPAPTSPPVTVSREAAAAAEVLKLVDDERAKAGCTPLAANSSLTGLAGAFSDDMAARGFFDHTDPDGRTPWDRAAKAGITGLGGENIARGQADAAAVTNAWMNSPGHRANILNCGFKTLGVGVHFGPGGPWWTADFGF
ncbi:CAP domain-containing protein [Streptomyces rameus]